MYAMTITNDCGSFTNCTDNENDDIKFIFEYLLLSVTSSIIQLFLIGVVIWSMNKSLKNG